MAQWIFRAERRDMSTRSFRMTLLSAMVVMVYEFSMELGFAKPPVQRVDPESEQKVETRTRGADGDGDVSLLDSFLDKPVLDPNEFGGPLEPLKDFIRDDP